MDSPPALSLTERQRDALRSIVVHIDQHGVAPSVVELGQALGLRTRMGAYPAINALEFKGYVRREYGVARSLVVLRDEQGVEVEGESRRRRGSPPPEAERQSSSSS